MVKESQSFRLETPRLTLRDLLEVDIDFLAEMLAHPEVMRYWPRPLTRAEAENWLQRHMKSRLDHDRGFWLVQRKDDGVPIGQVGLLRQEFSGRVETGLGYMLHRPFWHQGFALESCQACLHCGFEQLDLERIVILIRPENKPSLALARRLDAELVDSTDFHGFEHYVFEVINPGNR